MKSHSNNREIREPNVYLQNSGIEVKANNYVDSAPVKGSAKA
jgi:hypothetical protein